MDIKAMETKDELTNLGKHFKLVSKNSTSERLTS